MTSRKRTVGELTSQEKLDSDEKQSFSETNVILQKRPCALTKIADYTRSIQEVIRLDQLGYPLTGDALETAVALQHNDTAEYLFARGCTVTARAITLAMRHRNLGQLQMLCRRYESHDGLILYLAVCSGWIDAVICVCESGCMLTDSALQYAFLLGRHDIIQYLFAIGCPVPNDVLDPIARQYIARRNILQSAIDQ